MLSVTVSRQRDDSDDKPNRDTVARPVKVMLRMSPRGPLMKAFAEKCVVNKRITPNIASDVWDDVGDLMSVVINGSVGVVNRW